MSPNLTKIKPTLPHSHFTRFWGAGISLWQWFLGSLYPEQRTAQDKHKIVAKFY